MDFIRVRFTHKAAGDVYVLARREFDPAVHTLVGEYVPEPAVMRAAGDTPRTPDDPKLRTDGPTLDEYLAAGYQADTYPPTGYRSQPSDLLDFYLVNGTLPTVPAVDPAPAVPPGEGPPDQKPKRQNPRK